MAELTDEVVLNCDGLLCTDPAIGIRARAQEFIASRSLHTDQIYFGDQSEPEESQPCWSICFALGLDHIKSCPTDGFADVSALVVFLRGIAAETQSEFTLEVRYQSKLWYSEHITFVDSADVDYAFIRDMIERVA